MNKKSKFPVRGLVIALSFIAAQTSMSIYHNGVKDGQATLHAHVKKMK